MVFAWAWQKTSLLGRASSITDFIKVGEEFAEVEVVQRLSSFGTFQIKKKYPLQHIYFTLEYRS